MRAYKAIAEAEPQDITAQDRLLEVVNCLRCPINVVQDSSDASFIVWAQTLIQQWMIDGLCG